MKKAFRKITSFVLVVVILLGSGYLSYGVLKNMKMPMSKNTSISKDASMSASTESSEKDQKPKLDNEFLNFTLQNKNDLENSINALEEFTNTITQSHKNLQDEVIRDSEGEDKTNKSDTTVNVYQSNKDMRNVGKNYSYEKMENLHLGLYKISMGIEYLKQLEDDLNSQMVMTSSYDTSSNQYLVERFQLIVERRNKLIESLKYINEAIPILNSNPYINEEMSAIHESMIKLSKGVVTLNGLSNHLIKEASDVKSRIESKQNMNNGQEVATNTSMSTSIDYGNIVSVVLIIFGLIFVLSIAGGLMSYFRKEEI